MPTIKELNFLAVLSWKSAFFLNRSFQKLGACGNGAKRIDEGVTLTVQIGSCNNRY